MKITRCLLLLMASGFCSISGCQRQDVAPSFFRLAVQDVVADEDFQISLLTVYYPQATCISIDGEGFHHKIYADKARNSRQGKHLLPLIAARVADADGEKAFVQTHIVRDLNVESISPEERLSEFFGIFAKEGTYKLNTPITIARYQGKPVTLVVGKPTL
ncbi:MAG: hypothetical protein JXB10_16990 [Pirellulales bacterium]|nr:hypothetical protein [Pirellulales bacterium]